MWKTLLSVSVLLAACASPQSPVSAETPAAPAPAAKTAAPAPALTLSQEQKFERWRADFTARAIAKGYSADMLARTVGTAVFQPSAVASNESQPEFVKPIWAYVQTATSAARLNKGKAKLAEHSALFDRIEARYGVDRHVLTAIWGLESSYGAVLGDYNAFSALASFAYDGRRTEFGEAQIYGLLDLLSAGDVRESQLKSSWAGAMGMTQFIPTTFRDYAVDFDGDGNKDLWGSEADALASAANYLSRFGWVAAEPVFAEVVLPAGYDYSLSDGRRQSVAQWSASGVRPAHGGGFNPGANDVRAKLYVPAGASGPKLLTFKNFDVIKRYNNSNSYVMGITSLALNLGGKPAIQAPWPQGDKGLTRTQKTQLQTALTALGFDTQGIDGQIGPNSIRAIRAWQAANGVTPDGYVAHDLYGRIVRAAGLAP